MYDAVIVGAGPAGLSAAIASCKQGMKVIVLDEFPQPGGRLLGQLHQEPNGQWWNGIEETNKLMEETKKLSIPVECGISVHTIEKLEVGFRIYTNEGKLESKKLLLATGAAEKPFPLPGWTLPGVMSIGAAQVMTNVHRVRVGQKGIIVGINVLSFAIARELQLAGIEIESIVLPQLNSITENSGDPKTIMASLARVGHLAPSAFLRFGSKFAKYSIVQQLALQFFPKSGLSAWGMPIHLRKALVSINGKDQVESVTICDIHPDGQPIKGSETTIDVDFVCIAGGLYPLMELAALVGCPANYVEELGGHVPIHNEQMETPLEGLYVAGNITGVESAKIAISQGTLAGLSMAKDKVKEQSALLQKIEEAKIMVKQVREQALIQFHPDISKGRENVENAYKEYMNLI